MSSFCFIRVVTNDPTTQILKIATDPPSSESASGSVSGEIQSMGYAKIPSSVSSVTFIFNNKPSVMVRSTFASNTFNTYIIIFKPEEPERPGKPDVNVYIFKDDANCPGDKMNLRFIHNLPNIPSSPGKSQREPPKVNLYMKSRGNDVPLNPFNSVSVLNPVNTYLNLPPATYMVTVHNETDVEHKNPVLTKDFEFKAGQSYTLFSSGQLFRDHDKCSVQKEPVISVQSASVIPESSTEPASGSAPSSSLPPPAEKLSTNGVQLYNDPPSSQMPAPLH